MRVLSHSKNKKKNLKEKSAHAIRAISKFQISTRNRYVCILWLVNEFRCFLSKLIKPFPNSRSVNKIPMKRIWWIYLSTHVRNIRMAYYRRYHEKREEAKKKCLQVYIQCRNKWRESLHKKKMLLWNGKTIWYIHND